MNNEYIADLHLKLEQLDWLLCCVLASLDRSDTESASIGIALSLDKLSEIRKTLSTCKENMEEYKNE